MHLFTIEGNIGAGKSTLIQNLCEIKNIGTLPLIFLPEPVDVWETVADENGRSILQLFYADQVKYSFAFQMMTFISRYCLLEETISANPGAVIVTERSLYTDYHVFATLLHETGCMNEVEYAIYQKWIARFNKFALAGIIYIECAPSKALERCARRNRAGETVDLAYLELCDAKHAWIDEFDAPLLVLDGDQEISEDLMEDWVDSICLFMIEETAARSPPWTWKLYTNWGLSAVMLLFYCHTVFYYGVGFN